MVPLLMGGMKKISVNEVIFQKKTGVFLLLFLLYKNSLPTLKDEVAVNLVL